MNDVALLCGLVYRFPRPAAPDPVVFRRVGRPAGANADGATDGFCMAIGDRTRLSVYWRGEVERGIGGGIESFERRTEREAVASGTVDEPEPLRGQSIDFVVVEDSSGMSSMLSGGDGGGGPTRSDAGSLGRRR